MQFKLLNVTEGLFNFRLTKVLSKLFRSLRYITGFKLHALHSVIYLHVYLTFFDNFHEIRRFFFMVLYFIIFFTRPYFIEHLKEIEIKLLYRNIIILNIRIKVKVLQICLKELYLNYKISNMLYMFRKF